MQAALLALVIYDVGESFNGRGPILLFIIQIIYQVVVGGVFSH